MKSTIKLALGVLLGFFSFIAVAYLAFLAVTMIVWFAGVI